MRSIKLSTNQVQAELFCVSYVANTPLLIKTPNTKLKFSKAIGWLAQNINYLAVVIAFLISTSAIAQKTAPDPGVGGTVASFEVEAYKPALNPNQNLSNLNELNVYPNPFSSLTTIEFKIEQAGKVAIHVYNINGKLVSTLYDNNLEAGTVKQVTMDGSNLPDGIYFTHLTVNNVLVKTSKIVLLK